MYKLTIRRRVGDETYIARLLAALVKQAICFEAEEVRGDNGLDFLEINFTGGY